MHTKNVSEDKIDIFVVDLEPTPYKYDLWGQCVMDTRVKSFQVFFSRPSVSKRNGHNFVELQYPNFHHKVFRDDSIFHILKAILVVSKRLLLLRPKLVIISGYVDVLPAFTILLCIFSRTRFALYTDVLNVNKNPNGKFPRTLRYFVKLAVWKVLKYFNVLVLSCGKLGLQSVRTAGFSQNLSIDFPYAVNRNRLISNLKTPPHEIIVSDLTPTKIVVLFSGRMIERKGLRTLLMAASELIGNPSMFIWIEGTGPLLGEYKKLSEDMGLSYCCRFLGASEESIHNWYINNADIICVPSLWDPWGIVVDEGMQLGKIVIASNRVGSAIDRIEPGVNGFIFEAGDYRELASTLRVLVEDPNLRERVGSQAQLTSARYTPKRNIDNLFCGLEQIGLLQSR